MSNSEYKRIREIALESGIDLYHQNAFVLGFLDTKTKKFARSIIYETLDVIVKSYGDHINPKIAIEAVKKHFDVAPIPIGYCGCCGEPRYYGEEVNHDEECITLD